MPRGPIAGRYLRLFPGEGGPPWWDPDEEGLCVWAAYQPKRAGNFAASLLDLTGNGNNAIDPGGANTPAWDAANGWKFDGINDYLTTTFVPQNDQSQSMIVQYTDLTNIGYICGSNDGAGIRFAIRPNTGASVRYENGGARTQAPGLAAGNLAVVGDFGYRNGIIEPIVAIPGWAGAPISSVAIGAFSTGSYCAVYIQTFAIYDCTLTAPQVLAVATAMAAL